MIYFLFLNIESPFLFFSCNSRFSFLLSRHPSYVLPSLPPSLLCFRSLPSFSSCFLLISPCRSLPFFRFPRQQSVTNSHKFQLQFRITPISSNQIPPFFVLSLLSLSLLLFPLIAFPLFRLCFLLVPLCFSNPFNLSQLDTPFLPSRTLYSCLSLIRGSQLRCDLATQSVFVS